MSDEDPFAEDAKTTETGDGSFTEITVKAGMYQSHILTVRRPTLAEVEQELAATIKATVGAQASLERAVNEEKGKPSPSAPGNYGKPSGASESTNTELPFASSGVNETSDSKGQTCKHGARQFVEYGGRKAWICAEKPKGDPERCETVFV